MIIYTMYILLTAKLTGFPSWKCIVTFSCEFSNPSLPATVTPITDVPTKVSFWEPSARGKKTAVT